MLNLSMVAVPVFLDAALKSTQTSERQILDVEAMSRITSRDDVAFYAVCNNYLDTLVSGQHPALTALLESFPRYPILGSDSWRNVKADKDGRYPTEVEHRNNVRRILDRQEMREIAFSSYAGPEGDALALKDGIRQEIEKALMHSCKSDYMVYPAPTEGECVDSPNILPRIFYIKDNVYGVRFSWANSSFDYIVQLHHTISEVLETLCAHHPFAEVAKLPIFTAFVNICRDLPGFSLT